MGSVPVWASVIILLVIGIVVGMVAGAILSCRCRRRHLTHRRLETGPTPSQDEFASQSSWVPAVLRFKRAVPQASPVTTLRVSGPLSNEMEGSTLGAPHSMVPVDNPAFRTTQREPSPALRNHLHSIAARAGGGPLDAIEMQEQIPSILEHQASLRKQGSTIKAYPEADLQDTHMEDLVSGGSHNLFTVGRGGDAEIARQALKVKEAEAVGRSYDLDDLDDEWKELLCQIDARLVTLRKGTLDSQDRAVAIRSLLVSTARETPEQALAKAILDVERFRRSQRT